MINNYSHIVERIAKASGKEIDEINRLIEAKRAKLSGLISREGAAQIIASELGISFEKEKMKISELLDGLKKVNVVGKIIRMFPVRGYKKNDREGKIGSFIVADETGNVRCVLWDMNHISLIEKEEIKENDIVEITNANVRNMEIHLTGFSDIKLSQEKIENIKTEKIFYERSVSELKIGESVKIRAVIVQVFEPRFFEVCPECNGKVIKSVDGSICEKHGKILPLKRSLISLVLDDGNGNIRAVVFHENIEKLGLNINEIEEKFINKREDLLGKEVYFIGDVRQNRLFNNLEFFISDIEGVDIEKLIEELEKG